MPKRCCPAIAVAIVAVAIAIGGGPARADPPATSATAAASPIARPHELYIEGLGRGGLWGVGYGYQLRSRLGLGVVGSYQIIDGQHVTSLSPFVTIALAGSARDRWFVDVGPQLVHASTPSRVPDWSGTSTTGFGAQIASGYEHRGHLLLRVFAMAVVGKHGPAPWIGADVGWTL